MKPAVERALRFTLCRRVKPANTAALCCLVTGGLDGVRMVLPNSARVQTVVYIPLLDGVVELGTTEKEGKRRRHTLGRTIRTPSSPPVTRQHKAAVFAGLTLRQRVNRRALSTAGFFGATPPRHSPPLAVLSS
ncbi:unnamed protein product [Camellia sinensis]